MVREICKDVLFLARKSEPATPDDLPVAADLLETLQAHADGCVGLAANMIGVSRCIIAFDDEGAAGRLYQGTFGNMIQRVFERCARRPFAGEVMSKYAAPQAAMFRAELVASVLILLHGKSPRPRILRFRGLFSSFITRSQASTESRRTARYTPQPSRRFPRPDSWGHSGWFSAKILSACHSRA